MSGQRNTNPWATTGWGTGSSSSSGASKTVAQAQAERERRQKEREELTAAKRLQKTWRGYRDRQKTKTRHRVEYDAVYEQSQDCSASDRIAKVSPLLLALFDAKRDDDQARLGLFVQEFGANGSDSAALDVLSPTQQDKLARIIVAALERYTTSPGLSPVDCRASLSNISVSRRPLGSSQALLQILANIIKKRPTSITTALRRYYRILARYFAEGAQATQTANYQVLSDAVSAPLKSNYCKLFRHASVDS